MNDHKIDVILEVTKIDGLVNKDIKKLGQNFDGSETDLNLLKPTEMLLYLTKLEHAYTQRQSCVENIYFPSLKDHKHLFVNTSFLTML